MIQGILDEADTDYQAWCDDGKDKEQFLGGLSGELLKVMRNDEKTADDKMHSSGKPYYYDKMTSAIFCHNNTFRWATVSTTVLIIDSEGTCVMTELQYGYPPVNFKNYVLMALNTLNVDFCGCKP